MSKTDKELYEFCRGHYYVNDGDGIDYLWEPFEGHHEDKIGGWIKNDIIALKRFINSAPKEWNEESN